MVVMQVSVWALLRHQPGTGCRFEPSPSCVLCQPLQFLLSEKNLANRFHQPTLLALLSCTSQVESKTLETFILVAKEEPKQQTRLGGGSVSVSSAYTAARAGSGRALRGSWSGCTSTREGESVVSGAHGPSAEPRWWAWTGRGLTGRCLETCQCQLFIKCRIKFQARVKHDKI